MAFCEGPQGPSSHNKVSPVNLNLPFLSRMEEFFYIADHRSNLHVFFFKVQLFVKRFPASAWLHGSFTNTVVEFRCFRPEQVLFRLKETAESVMSEVITSLRWKCSLKGRFWEDRGLRWTCEESGVEMWIDLTEALGRNWSSALVKFETWSFHMETVQGSDRFKSIWQILDIFWWLHKYKFDQFIKTSWSSIVSISELNWHSAAAEPQKSRRSNQGFDIYAAGNQLILSLLLSYSETDLTKVVAPFQEIIIF